MVLLENDAFLVELAKMFQSVRSTSSVSLTMKRYDGTTKPKSKDNSKKPQPEPTEYTCLVRAKTNQRKIATIIHSKEMNKIQLAYSNLLKSNLDGLKKMKKSKAKSKAAQ